MSKTIREALDNYCETLTGQRPETRTILDSLNAITEANGGTPSQGGLVDAIDCFCACSGGGGSGGVFPFRLLASIVADAPGTSGSSGNNVEFDVSALNITSYKAVYFVPHSKNSTFGNCTFDITVTNSGTNSVSAIEFLSDSEDANGMLFAVCGSSVVTVPFTSTEQGHYYTGPQVASFSDSTAIRVWGTTFGPAATLTEDNWLDVYVLD